MKETNCINNLISMSHQVGQNIEYVQGGGGNTSAKSGKDYMFIKASGIALKDMSVNQGIAKVDYKKVNAYHDLHDESESLYSAAINNLSLTPNARPSIETGFHAILGNYVIHSHSIFLNIFLCANEGKDILLNMFPESLWINYCNPGKELTFQIKKALSRVEKKENNFEGLIFLQNHGVISSASNFQDCLFNHSQCNQKLIEHYNLNEFELVSSNEFELPKNFLFPDQVVYMSPEQINKKTQSFLETISSVKYIENGIRELSLTPRYLKEQEILMLNSMKSEEYRKKISK